MVIKTKDILVDVARTLFATKGFANTTMNDIANASNKGRRTLYTYFKNKDEVLYAVIQAETIKLRDSFKILAYDMAFSPMDRLINYIYVRLEAVKDVVNRNGGLEAEFFQNQNKVERVRRRLDFSERNFLKSILEEGNQSGDFNVSDTSFMAMFIQSALKGMELPFIRGELAIGMSANKELVYQLFSAGLKPRLNNLR